MDLHHLHTYIRPQQLEDLTAWDPGWNWLAGGTWLFSQPQPHLRGLIDLHPLDWNELEISAEGLSNLYLPATVAIRLATPLARDPRPVRGNGIFGLFQSGPPGNDRGKSLSGPECRCRSARVDRP